MADLVQGILDLTNSIANAIKGKQDTLVSNTNIKTINNETILGSGNIDTQTLFIQNDEPILTNGKQALWVDTSNGNITLNIVIGD